MPTTRLLFQPALHRQFGVETKYLRWPICFCQQQRSLFYLPTVLTPSFWRSLKPTFLRRRTPSEKLPRNPATFLILVSLFIGSQSIQLVTLRQSHAKFTQETETRLALLRDVVRRVKAGEEVDVEKELGTGESAAERDWEEVMKELESEDKIFGERRREERKRQEQEQEQSREKSEA